MVTGSSFFEKIFIRVDEKASDTAERIQNPSPRKFNEGERPLRLIRTIPQSHKTHAVTFFTFIFSSLNAKAEIRIAKKVDEPVKIVPLTPLVFASPT